MNYIRVCVFMLFMTKQQSFCMVIIVHSDIGISKC